MAMMQVKAGTAPTPRKQHESTTSEASTQPALVINPVGASSNYTNAGFTSVNKPTAATQGQGTAVAAPSSSCAGSDTHVVSGKHVDQAHHGEAKTTADEPSAEMNTSQLDRPGLAGPQGTALPGYQVCCLDSSWFVLSGRTLPLGLVKIAGKPPLAFDTHASSPHGALHHSQTYIVVRHSEADLLCTSLYCKAYATAAHKQHGCD